MSEKMPSGNEEEIDTSRRGFLKGLGALGAVGSVIGVAHLVNRSGEELPKDPPPFFEEKTPYEIPVENLS